MTQTRVFSAPPAMSTPLPTQKAAASALRQSTLKQRYLRPTPRTRENKRDRRKQYARHMMRIVGVWACHHCRRLRRRSGGRRMD